MAANPNDNIPLLNFGRLRSSIHLLPEDLRWEVDSSLSDDQPLPTHMTGAIVDGQPIASTVPLINFASLLSPVALLRPLAPGDHPAVAAPLPAAPPFERNVDWRNRWGLSFLCTVQDQGRCSNCWAFAVAALIETMVRIEHNIWSKRSEGDIRDGWHKISGALAPSPCLHGANVVGCLEYVKSNGAADPDCFAWKADDLAYTPTPDRPGRSTRNLDWTSLGTADDQKRWIDLVGPIVACFDCYEDLFAYKSGVYRKTLNANPKGGHCVLIVGYDDDRKCWIIRNSWGSYWGQAGYGEFAYGNCNIDHYSKQGIKGVNPDPWVKRRLHNGCMISGGNGARHQNFELVRNSFPFFRHLWRRDTDLSWRAAGPVATVSQQELLNWDHSRNCIGMPCLISSTYNRNFELVYREAGGRLRNWYFDQETKHWNDVGSFGDGMAAGYPGYMQSNFGAPGNFEVVVMGKDGRLQHYWRHNTPWQSAGAFGSNVLMSGPSLVQANVGKQGHFYLVAVMQTGDLQMWWKDNDTMTWYAGDIFGTGFSATPPVMAQCSFGTTNETDPGNFELFIAVGGGVQHWWRDNSLLRTEIPPQGKVTDPAKVRWHQGFTFGRDVRNVWATTQGVGRDYMEVIVERHDNKLQQYYRGNGKWWEGAIIDI